MSSIKKLMAIDKEVSKNIIDREINVFEANDIIATICEKLDLPKMSIHFCFYVKKADCFLRKLCRFFKKEELYDLYEEMKGSRKITIGEAYHEKNHIVLYSYGHTITVLLHEMAHLMPNGYRHGKKWIKNLKEVVEVYNEICACRQADMAEDF